MLCRPLPACYDVANLIQSDLFIGSRLESTTKKKAIYRLISLNTCTIRPRPTYEYDTVSNMYDKSNFNLYTNDSSLQTFRSRN